MSYESNSKKIDRNPGKKAAEEKCREKAGRGKNLFTGGQPMDL
tara:strand:+ start:4320 stop:4448 length:129 start_codon:yes stop_codon:yes gene_type:complete